MCSSPHEQYVLLRVAGQIQHATPLGGKALAHLGLPLPHLQPLLQDQADLHQPPGHMFLEAAGLVASGGELTQICGMFLYGDILKKVMLQLC